MDLRISIVSAPLVIPAGAKKVHTKP